LAATRYLREEVDVCPDCGGTWFDDNELNRMLSATGNGEDQADYIEYLGEELGPTELTCPTCQSSLHGYHLLKDYHVKVDICPNCNGTWIEQKELEQVKCSPQIRDMLATINKSTSWKTWVIQFLSQMPVEYNIKPHRTPWVTRILLVINSLIFLAMLYSDSAATIMFTLFTSSPLQIAHVEHWWGPLTCIFLHGSVMHLIGNMYFLYVVGDNLEDVLGHWKFLSIYLFCGVSASMISVLFNWNSEIPSVGASGAIAALFGMYLLWFRHASLTFMFFFYQKKLSPAWYFMIWVVFNVIGMASGGIGIDYWAHLGGFLIGLGLGFALKRRIFEQNPILEMLSAPEANIVRA
jgi:membrane associated rhomboid family serine protease